MFVYGEPAERVIFVRAALISVEEAARVSRESVPNDGSDIKEHDGSVSEGFGILPRAIFQLMTALLSICLPRRYGERKRHPGARNTNGGM